MPDTDLARVEALQAFELEHRLFDTRVFGWSPWRVLRGPVQLMHRHLPLGASNRAASARVIEAGVATLRLMSVLVFGRRRQVIVKTSRTALRSKVGDRYRDIYFDGILALGVDFLKLEEINADNLDREASNALFPAQVNPIAFTFWGRILAVLFPARAATAFCRSVSQRLAQDLDMQVDPKLLLRLVSTVWWQSKLYGLLLRRIRPSAVLVSDTAEYALRIACSDHAVRFIELQHGVFDRHHRDAVPIDVAGSKSELLLPDVLACRGAFWINELQDTRQGRDCAVAVGNELIDQTRSAVRERADGDRRIILFSSQGYSTDAVAEWLATAIRCAPGDVNWQLVIKLHPAYDRDTRSYDTLAEHPDVTVVAGMAEPNIFQLLAQADLHLSISSACLFDAAALGVRSGLVPLPTHETLLYAVDDVTISLCHQPEDIWPLLARAPMPGAAARSFSEPGFVDNMLALIESAGRNDSEPPRT